MAALPPGDTAAVSEARARRPAAARVARNTVLRAAAEIIGKVASLVLVAVIARELGRAALGDFTLALAVSQLIWPIAGFGLDRLLLRDAAVDHDVVDRAFYDLVAFKALVGVVAIGGAVAASAALDYSATVTALVALLGAGVVVVLVSATAQTVFLAHERNEYFFAASVPNKVFASLFGLAAIAAGGGVVAVAAGNLVASLIGLVIALVLLYRRFNRPALRVAPRGWPALLERAVPFGLQEVFGQIVFRLDIVLLSLLTTSLVVGAYGAAYRMLEATLFLVWSVGTSVLPMYSYLRTVREGGGEPGQPTLEQAFSGSLKFIVVLMMPVSVVLFVCARPIIDVVFGLPEYESAVTVLRWLAFAVLAYGVGHLAGLLVLVRLKGAVTVGVTAAAAAFNLVVNLLLIPPYGAAGAAAATLATQVLLAVVALVLAARAIDAPLRRAVPPSAILAGAAMAAAMLPVSDRLALALAAGVAAYLAVLAAVEALLPDGDLKVVRTLFTRRRARAASP
jgi:O-antigen/teichoic acid export membrane protein